MFLLRRIGRLLRGKATPLQIYLACILGALIGFAPEFMQAPALVITLLVVLVVLNANLTAAFLTAIPAALVALVAMPLSVQFGRILLDGPTEPVFRALVNAPVLALFGFEYYATTGGLVIGIAFGAVVGFAFNRAITSFRRRMADLEEGSEPFRRYTSAWWARTLTWIFVGGSHGNLTYRELLEQSRSGNPIRIAGLIAVVITFAVLLVTLRLAIEPIAAWAIQRGLERANGATVDVEHARLDLGTGRLEAVGLAMADPNDLHTDLLRAGRIEVDIGMADLLRRRLRLNHVVLTDTVTGAQRERPGERVGPLPIPTPPDVDDWQWGDRTLEEVLHDADVWKQRLAQLRDWLERIDRLRPDPAERRETLQERLEREIRQHGYHRVAAAHLVDHAPWVTIATLVAARIEAIQLDGEMLEIEAQHLSTQPWLLAAAPRVRVRSETGRFEVEIELAALTRNGTGENTVRASYTGLQADAIGQRLAIGDVPVVQGGTIDVAFDGRWSAGIIDFPLQVTVRNSRLTIPEIGTTDVSELVLPISVRGPLDNPRVTLDDDDLADALVAAGRSEIAGRVRAEAGDVREQIEERVEERIERERERLFERLIPQR